MRDYVKKMSVILSLVVAFVSVFSSVAFAAETAPTWDEIPNLFFDEQEEPPAEPVPGDSPTPEYNDTVDDGIETGGNDEEGPGEYFDLPNEVAGGEELAGEGASEEITSSEEFSGEENLSNEEGYIPEEVPSDEEVTGDAEVAGTEADEASAELTSTVRKDYQQPSFHVKSGYDAISVFVTADMSNTTYQGKIYFIRNISTGQWLMYNYKPETASLYFDKTEEENNLRVPSKKADTRSDAAETAVNETKVPLITYTAFIGMYCNWRTLSDIPFTKDSNGNYLYATYEVQDNGGNGNGNGSGNGNGNGGTTTSSNYYKYVVKLDNGNTYSIYVTAKVSYNGTKHVLSTAKSGKKKTADIKVYVYLNNQLVEPKLYKVKFKNNLNCNGYGGKEKVYPYIRIKLKYKNKALKGDIKAIWKHGFGFRILPLDISKGTVSYKKNKNGELKNATVTISGNTMKLNPPKGNKGDYTLNNENGQTVVVGRNNFFGKLALGATNIYSSNTGNNTGIY